MHSSSASLRRMRIAVALFFFCQGLGFATWASRIPLIKAKMNLSEADLGFILLLMPLGQLITMSISGRLATYFGSRKVLRLACMGYASVLVLIGFAETSFQLSCAIFLFGVFGNMSNISVNTQALELEQLYQRSIISSFHGAWSLAGFVGALIGLISLNLNINTLTHFIIIFFVFLTNTLINQGYLVRGKPHAKSLSAKKFEKPDALLLQLGLLGFLCMATEGAMFDWTGVYFKEVVNAPVKWITLGYAAFMVMMASGRFLGDKIISKIGKQKTLQLSGVFMFSGMMLSAIFPEMIVCTFAFMLVGIGVSCVVPSVYSITGTHPSIAPGRALAMVSSISYLGFLIGPPMIGYIGELFSLRISFAIFACFGLILFLIVGQMHVMKSNSNSSTEILEENMQ